jgi:hypothetical protein
VAHVLGAGLGVLLTGGYVVWKRLRPPPCTGAVFVELRPPLAAPGPYHFRLSLDDDERGCAFDVQLPMKRRVDTKACKMALTLETRVHGTTESILGLTIGAAPERFRFRVTRGSELIYDTELQPRYAPYATLREESKRFCGDRAFVKPECLRGSSQCAPYVAACSGPEVCGGGQVCCVSPDRAREYGAYAAAECSSQRSCLDRFAQIACRKDADCPSDMRCSDRSLAREFHQPLSVCASASSQR